MNKTIGWSIVGAILVIAALFLAVPRLLNGGSAPATTSSSVVGERPDCPFTTVRGVDLPCLGGEKAEAGEGDVEKQIVNIWAWWCEPCREELPMLADFARDNPDWEVVLVHADRDEAKGSAMLTEMGIDLPSYSDKEGKFAATLSLPNVVPLSFIGNDLHTGPITELP